MMFFTRRGGILAALMCLWSAAPSGQAPSDAPQFTPSGELVRPADFREWMFVTSGLGMTYNEPANPDRPMNFTNVYVNPTAYRAFNKTGRWPDGTMFILEIRASSTAGSINKGGHFQSGLSFIEASVKDTTRFPGNGWAFFNWGRDLKTQVAALPRTERCYACHAEHGALDNTFVQFYPTLLETAVRMGVLQPPAAK